MPLLSHQKIDGDGELGLWQIEEEEHWFLERLDLKREELQQLAAMKGKRRVEWLAARQLVHQMSGRGERLPFLKDEYGKPYLADSDHHISISHSAGVAAAIAAPIVVGIDVQHWVPRLERLMHKFMSREEINGLADAHRLHQLHIFWGAKEALYKAYGRRALDFCEHMKIESFDYQPEGGESVGRIAKNAYQASFRLFYKMIGAYVLVYVMEE